ncbi:MAG: alpha/beta hydrolase [Dehalococcoidia bacterium]
MAATIPTTFEATRFAWLRQIGPGHALFGAALGFVWLHLVDATFVHPQRNAMPAEHVLLAAVGLLAPPLGFAAYPRIRRAVRGVIVAVVGLAAMSAGSMIHFAGLLRNGEWNGGDFTGVPMTFAGLVMVVLGIALCTWSIPRTRYRLLVIPALIPALLLIIVPTHIATFIAHAPRQIIEPQDLGAAYETVSFETSDGLTLRGWYVPSRNGAAVALIHGSGGSRMGPARHARMLVRHGYGVLLFDVRGHGESDGTTNALGWGAYPDSKAARDYLASRPDVDPNRIGLLGLSMGAEIAIESAAHDDGYAAIVADGPSGRTFADARDSSLPAATLVVASGTLLSYELLVAAMSGAMPPPSLVSRSPDVNEPILYIASGDAQEERALVTRIAEHSGGDSALWIIDGAGHTQGLKTFPQVYEERVVQFFDRLLR